MCFSGLFVFIYNKSYLLDIKAMGNKIEDKMSVFLTEVDGFVEESNEMAREYWRERNSKGYLIEKKGNLMI
jgi:hypothetical protein